MQAAILKEFGRPLLVTEVPTPVPAEGEALVRVVAAGVCGTDLKIASGAFAPTTPLPLILGHEIAGELVSEVDGLPKGKRVACYHYRPCGDCRWCRAGEFTLCPRSRRLGFERDGGLAEFVSVPRGNLIPFSDDTDFALAAVSMDAVTAPWRAIVTRARLRRGETLVVAGAGGLGLCAVQIATALGAKVAAIDPVAGHRELALEQGAEVVADPSDVSSIRAWAPDGVDAGFESSGTRAGLDSLIQVVTPGGRVVCCGYRPGVEYGLDSAHLVLDEITLLGSRAGSRDDARDALRAVESGIVKPQIMARLRLAEVNRALDLLREGKVLGRVVVIQ